MENLFHVKKPIIGMVHLPPLPGSPFYKGEAIDSIIDYALNEAKKLKESDFDGVLVENFGDSPFTLIPKDPETIASMAVIVKEIVKNVEIPVRVNMLRNGGLQALAIAHASGAKFIRVNALVETLVTDQGIVKPIAHELLKMRNALKAEKVKILADIYSKHAAPLVNRPIEVVAKEAFERGKADFLIVTGHETGKPPSIDLIKTVKNSSKVPVLVGSGLTIENANRLLQVADGGIIGTYIKVNGIVSNQIDCSRATKFMEFVKKLREAS
ncbi:MAG: BtpA/SgcQ family protein [Candidatus Bathyarchaeia archaeon]